MHRYCKIVVLPFPLRMLAEKLSLEARMKLIKERQAASDASYVNLITNCGAKSPTG